MLTRRDTLMFAIVTLGCLSLGGGLGALGVFILVPTLLGALMTTGLLIASYFFGRTFFRALQAGVSLRPNLPPGARVLRNQTVLAREPVLCGASLMLHFSRKQLAEQKRD